MSESIHNKLKRVRKPRVHITYDVETNGAEVKKNCRLLQVSWVTTQVITLKTERR